MPPDKALGTLEIFKEQGVQLHMLDLSGDATGNGISKLVFTILSAVAENERDRSGSVSGKLSRT
jgi:putative DNA-invertase from lambdoid prophage Rac